VIEKNRIKSIESRSAIRAYAEEFAWDRIVQRYLETVTNIVRDKKIERSVSVMKKPSLAIVTIATGQYYDLFFNDFEASVVAQWSPHCDIKIYCFTDHPGSGNATTEVVSVRHMGWPFDTLLRYHLMASILDRLMAHDYILYLDADMIIKHSLDPQIFAHDLVAVQHPGFRTNPEAASFEIDVVASSFVPKEKRKHYVQGCFWGGKPFALKELLLTLTQKIDTDLGRGQVPIWHDESYLNWFLADKPFLLVSAAYAFPEGSDLPFDPIIIHRAKNHDVVRSADIKGLTAEQLMRGVSLEERAKNDRLLYLRAHEKNQALERYLLEASSKVSELLDEVAWLHARTVRARLKRFLKRAVKWIGRQITLLRKS